MSPASPETAAPSGRPPRRGRLRTLAWLTILWAGVYHGLPRLLTMPPELSRPPEPSSEITDGVGKPLRKLLANGQRVESLTFGQIPPRLAEATVSAEDQRFWSHGGIDVLGIVRATLDSLAAGRRVSGASTITQQLVKVATGRYAERSWNDKLREIAYARKVETQWSKERILTEYLQRVEYGNQVTGCAAAAELYFKKPLSDLSLAESAFLAGLPQAPSRLNPYRNFEGAKKRQEWILSRMRQDGRISAAEEERAVAESLRMRRWTGGFEAPHFVDLVLAGQKRSDRAGDGAARHEPLRTTLDLELQTICEQTVNARLNRLRSQHVHDAAVVVLDNRTGGVRAMVGSPDYFDPVAGQVNGALAARSAGSTLKPFTYLLAMEQGDSPATIVDDLPIEFITPTGLYAPENYDRHFHGPMSYREALANSLNISAVRVLRRIGGPAALQSALQSLGLTSLTETPEHYGLGLTIGNAEVVLLELVNAYACLARLGEWRPVVLSADEETDISPGARQLDPASCWMLADILSDPQARARCFGLDSPLRLTFPVAVKTGTSTDFRDNWCVGYTPEFTVGVWVGNFDRRPMDHVSGVSGAAPIWRDIMQWLERRRGVTWYRQPAAIAEASVDPLTGERIPPEWRARRPAVTEKFNILSVPMMAPASRYDAMGRVVLPRDYARWLRSDENWIGPDAVAGAGAVDDRGGVLQIVSPLAGATFILDPDLPGGGGRLPLRANSPVPAAEWSSPSLVIEHHGPSAFAHLDVGCHEIRVRNPATGETAVAAITVRSL